MMIRIGGVAATGLIMTVALPGASRLMFELQGKVLSL
jgi:hypothetical protein